MLLSLKDFMRSVSQPKCFHLICWKNLQISCVVFTVVVKLHFSCKYPAVYVGVVHFICTQRKNALGHTITCSQREAVKCAGLLSFFEQNFPVAPCRAE